VRLVVFCEAEDDFRTVSGLVDRLLRDAGPDWVREHLEHFPLEHLRTWVGCRGRPFFDLHRYRDEARDRGIRLPHARFEGRAGAPGFLAAQTAFLIARHVAETTEPVDAVLFVWDADNQGDARRDGWDQALSLGLHHGRFRVAFGCPDLEREAWVLAGFEPDNDAERELLEEERHFLRFCPCTEPHRLRDNKDHEPRSPKRVLRKLTGGDDEREEQCWTQAPLERLRARGVDSGLVAFLEEVKEHLVEPLHVPYR
jgi:hypothetical protein